MRFLSTLLLIATVFAESAVAELSLPSFFSDHMVLQRESEAAIWGNSDPDATVVVSFKNRTVETQANKDGRWRANLETGVADANGSSLKITSGPDSVTIHDVLVGEVWFASGQSNMVFTMNRVPDYVDVIAKSDHPQIRMFNAPTVTSVEPQDDINGEWTLCRPETVSGYSAVAFFFARKLHRELNIPIGVIKSAWGGKPVETFTSRDALNTLPGTKKLVDGAVAADASFDPVKAMASYKKRLEQWKLSEQKWRDQPSNERGRRPRRPAIPKRALDTEGQPGVLFNSMIHPFVGYTIRGAIWYQGEGNAKPGAVPYDQTLPLLINDWRSRWGQEFSFYFVQLANFRDPSVEPGNDDPWPLLQDRMRRVLDTTPKTGMAIINDVGEAKDIHPKNKHDVGERLALWALAQDYDQELVYCGPLFRSSEIDGGSVRVRFRHVGSGLKSRDGENLARFEIAGKDKVWHWADARITAVDTVTVNSKQVPKPVAVRYAWAANPKGANLINSAGLPASVFRTDDWSDVEPQSGTAILKLQKERQALASEIKAIAAKRAQLQRGSEEFNVLVDRQKKLMARFRAMAPKRDP